MLLCGKYVTIKMYQEVILMVRALLIRNGVVQIMDTSNIDVSSYSGDMSDIQSRDGLRLSTVPIQMVLITYNKKSQTPYHMSYFSPGSYAFIEMDKEGFSMVIPQNDLHTHNTYELCMIRDGTLSQRIESERHIYPEGSCFLLNRNVRHNEEYDSSFCTVTLSISEKYLKDTIREEISAHGSLNEYWDSNSDLRQFLRAELNSTDSGKKTYIDFIPSGNVNETAGLFEDIAQALLNPGPGQSFLVRSLLCRLLYMLTRKDIYSTVPVELGTASEGLVFSEIVRIMEAEKGRIGRQELSDRMHYSGNYLNRLSKKYTGMNLTDFSNSVSMRFVATMLLTTDLTVYEIAESLAFSNRRYFYKEFEKAYGTTPKKYRAEHRTAHG